MSTGSAECMCTLWELLVRNSFRVYLHSILLKLLQFKGFIMLSVTSTTEFTEHFLSLKPSVKQKPGALLSTLSALLQKLQRYVNES